MRTSEKLGPHADHTGATAPQPVDKRAPLQSLHRALVTIGNLLVAAFLFLVGVGLLAYSWNHTAPAFQSTLLTVVSGVSVIACGQAVQKLYIEPIQAMQALIGQINATLLFHRRAAESLLGNEQSDEAQREFRRLAGALLGASRIVPTYELFQLGGLVPPKHKVKVAAKALVQLSNQVGTNDHDGFRCSVLEVQSSLNLEDYEPA